MTFVSKADNHTGVMVALYPTPDIAALLAQPGGEPAETLHVTLAFLGDAYNLAAAQVDRLKQTVASFASRTAPIVGEVSGVGHFTAGPEPVTYASIDCPELAERRQSLVDSLTWDDDLPSPSTAHGFAPHCTLAYDDRQVELPNVPLTFETVSLCVGGERTDFPLYGVRKSQQWDVPIWKAEDPRPGVPLTVYGVVLHPGVTDSQGDVVSAEEIEKAAHKWLIESRMHDTQHDESAMPDAFPVESYIAPSDLVFKAEDGTERTVLKGSWVVGVAVYDEVRKQDVVAGRLTGFSIGGSAIRSEAAAA
jgi:2'-5' RNA ligase